MNAPQSIQELQRQFSRLSGEQQLREIVGQRWERVFEFDRASIDQKARTAWMSIASDRPYERWWGVEILEITRAAIRAERLDGGANILVDHDSRDVVGVIERWELVGSKLRVLARFGSSARAQEIWQDVLDGIRRNTSVGYIVHKALLVEKNEDVSTFRVTDWEPLEGSLVACPADPSVGPGRALEAPQIERTSMSTETPAPAGSTTEPSLATGLAKANDAARADERERIAKRNEAIIALGEQWPEYDGRELAMAAMAKANMTVEAFRAQMMDVLVQRRQPSHTGRVEPGQVEGGRPGGGTPYGMGARDMLHAASIKAFKGIGRYLKMDDQEAAYRTGMWCKGVIQGDMSALRWCRDAGVQLYQGTFDGARFDGQAVDGRAMSEGVFTSAGWLVPPEMQTAMIINREQYGIARRICRLWPMNSATMQIPRWLSGTTSYFVGEGTEGTQSDPSGDQVTLSLKDLMTTTRVGKSTAMDSAIPLAEFVVEEQSRSRAVKEDGILISGDGTSTYGGMQGCKTLLDAAAYAGGRAQATAGHDTFPEIDLTDVAGAMALLPVFARAGARFVCSGVFEMLVFGRIKMNAGGNTTQTLAGKVVESDYGGFPVSIAHDMPAGAGTTYNLVSILLFGNFNLGVAFGYAEQSMLTVDPYTRAKWNQTEITTVERVDIVAHGVNKSTILAGPIVALHGKS